LDKKVLEKLVSANGGLTYLVHGVAMHVRCHRLAAEPLRVCQREPLVLVKLAPEGLDQVGTMPALHDCPEALNALRCKAMSYSKRYLK
jgi:hypothetical protein